MYLLDSMHGQDRQAGACRHPVSGAGPGGAGGGGGRRRRRRACSSAPLPAHLAWSRGKFLLMSSALAALRRSSDPASFIRLQCRSRGPAGLPGMLRQQHALIVGLPLRIGPQCIRWPCRFSTLRLLRVVLPAAWSGIQLGLEVI